MNAFVDTNVILDVLLDRKPFAADSRKVWFLAERGKIKGFVSAVTFPNIYYIVRRLKNAKDAAAMMIMLRNTFSVALLDEQIMNQAIDAKFADFEDAVQFYSALRADAVCLITRDVSHYPASSIPILTPAEFLASHSFE